MKFKITEIAGDGRDFSEEISQDLIGTREDDQLSFTAPITVSGHIGLADQIVYVNGHASGKLAGLCAYTLERTEEIFDKDFSFDIEIDKNTQEVDVDEDIRQEILLGLPMRLISAGGREKAKEEFDKKRTYFNLNEDDQIDREEEKRENVYRPFENLNFDGLEDK